MIENLSINPYLLGAALGTIFVVIANELKRRKSRESKGGARK